MNDLELAELFIACAKLQIQISEIENKIATAVLERGETVEIAGVRATYKNASETVNWKQSAETHLADNPDAGEVPTKTSVSYQYKDFCENAGIPEKDLVYNAPQPARVAIKINPTIFGKE